MISAAILKVPERNYGRVIKGAIILSCPEEAAIQIPGLKDYFFIIERRGWRGMNESQIADIKLVEDLSTMEETKNKFPNAVLVDLAGGDFVDTDLFRPIGLQKDYGGIQISCWERFKRHELFVRAAALLPDCRFVKFGHFINGGSLEERAYRDSVIGLSKQLGANIDYPYSDLESNLGLPILKEEINYFINRCSFGVLTTKIEGVNRFKMECLAADVPVLVPRDTSYPVFKHINAQTGLVFDPTPEGLADGIRYVMEHRGDFSPRGYVLCSTGKRNSLLKLKGALKLACLRDGAEYVFDSIDYDGRNQSLAWGNRAVDLIKHAIRGVE